MVKNPKTNKPKAIKLSQENLLFLYKLQDYERETWNDLFDKLKNLLKKINKDAI